LSKAQGREARGEFGFAKRLKAALCLAEMHSATRRRLAGFWALFALSGRL